MSFTYSIVPGRSNSARYNKEKQEEIVQSVKTTTEQTKVTKASERNLRLRIEPNKIPFPLGPSSASPNLYQTNINPISFGQGQTPLTKGNATSPSIIQQPTRCSWFDPSAPAHLHWFYMPNPMVFQSAQRSYDAANCEPFALRFESFCDDAGHIAERFR